MEFRPGASHQLHSSHCNRDERHQQGLLISWATVWCALFPSRLSPDIKTAIIVGPLEQHLLSVAGVRRGRRGRRRSRRLIDDRTARDAVVLHIVKSCPDCVQGLRGHAYDKAVFLYTWFGVHSAGSLQATAKDDKTSASHWNNQKPVREFSPIEKWK